MAGPLDDRRRSLEEEFFRRQSEEKREKLRLQQEEQEAREEIAAASGIHDAELLARLAGLGIRAETLAALTLVPLVEVAWADGRMEERERDAVLRGAESTGLAKGSPSWELLRIWTEERPAPALMDTWAAYVRALCAELSAAQRARLEERILGRARAVAEAAGGILGMAAISRLEEGVLAKMEQAFHS